MAYRHVMTALAAAGVVGLAACESDNLSPASSGTDRTGPATASAPNAAPQGSNSSGEPVKPRSTKPETAPATTGNP